MEMTRYKKINNLNMYLHLFNVEPICCDSCREIISLKEKSDVVECVTDEIINIGYRGININTSFNKPISIRIRVSWYDCINKNCLGGTSVNEIYE